MQHHEIATIAVLASAVLHATWNAVVRGGTSRLHSLALVDASALLACCLCLPFVTVPSGTVLGFMLVSVVLNTGYRLFLVKAYERGDFGKVYPVVRGTPPILVAASSVVFFQESLSPQVYFGIALISVGILSLVGSDVLSRERLTPLIMAAAAGVFIAAYTVVDAKGVRIAGDAMQYIVYLTILQSIPIPVLATIRDRRGAVAFVKKSWRLGCFGGLSYVVSYGLILFAFTLDAVAKVSALRETSVLFAAVIAAVFLGEKFGPQRVLSSVVIVAGILAVKMNR